MSMIVFFGALSILETTCGVHRDDELLQILEIRDRHERVVLRCGSGDTQVLQENHSDPREQADLPL